MTLSSFLNILTGACFIMLLGCSSPLTIKHKKSQNKRNHKQYCLFIKSQDQFSATITFVKKRKNDAIKEILSFNLKDSNYRICRVKINTKDKWQSDSTFKFKNLKSFRSTINYIFSKIPYQKPSNCNYKYVEDKFVSKEAVIGNQLDTSKLYKLIFVYVTKKKTDLILNHEIAYFKPSYFLNTIEAKEGYKSLVKCLSSKITYRFEDKVISVTKDDFAEWLSLDSNMKVEIDDIKGIDFIRKIARENDIVEKNVEFTSSTGEIKSFSNSELGKRIDSYREFNQLKKDIISGIEIEREPIYGMNGIPPGAFDSNKSYVEISINAQKLWLYKNGELILESEIVSGCPKRGHTTPPGAFYVKYMQRGATLRGPGYSSFVNYWMPFNQGIGLHDALWRKKFGGDLFLRDGSHGCINLPLETAKSIFKLIQPGFIVLCY